MGLPWLVGVPTAQLPAEEQKDKLSHLKEAPGRLRLRAPTLGGQGHFFPDLPQGLDSSQGGIREGSSHWHLTLGWV